MDTLHTLTPLVFKIHFNIITCISHYRRVLDCMIGFIAPHTFTQFGTTGKYSTIVILHTFQFTVTHALGTSVFTSRALATTYHRLTVTSNHT
jgi:hypothetical protein